MTYTAAATDRGAKETFDLRQCTLVTEGASSAASGAGEPGAELEWTMHVGKEKMRLRAFTQDEKTCWLALLLPFHNAAPALASRTWPCLPIAPALENGLRACIEALGRDGCVQGVFRESGRGDEVQAIYLSFLRGGVAVPPGADVHAVAGCLKKMLREMPETLFTNKLFGEVVMPNPSPAKVRRDQLRAHAHTQASGAPHRFGCDGRAPRACASPLFLHARPSVPARSPSLRSPP